MAPAAPLVRLAVPGDAAAMAEVHVASWRATYRGLMPDRLIDGMEVAGRTAAWQRNLARIASGEIPDMRAWVVERDHAIVGFASLATSRDDDAVPEVGELQTLYLHPRAWGLGLGRALHAAAIDDAAARWRELTLWVLDGNLRAIRFYEAAGWRPDGPPAGKEWMGERLPHLRYRLALMPV